MAFWMGVASAGHARAGRDGGFAQPGHGRHMAVKSLQKGDWIVYCSPREGMGEAEWGRPSDYRNFVLSDRVPVKSTRSLEREPAGMSAKCRFKPSRSGGILVSGFQ